MKKNEGRNNNNYMKNSNIFSSVKFALEGILHVLKLERNFKIHLLFVIFVIIFSLILKVSLVECAVLTLTCGIVLICEIMNTAIESVVDLYCKDKYSYMGKIAKDCSAGAVLFSAIIAILVGVFIFFDKIALFLNI